MHNLFGVCVQTWVNYFMFAGCEFKSNLRIVKLISSEKVYDIGVNLSCELYALIIHTYTYGIYLSLGYMSKVYT